MKQPIPTLTAQAVADVFYSSAGYDCEKLADAALEHLRSCGCTLADMRVFPRILARALRKKGVGLSAHLQTPSGQSGAQRERIARALERALGRKLSLEEKADSLLLGGAVLTYGDERYDYSLSGALKRLETQLTAG